MWNYCWSKLNILIQLILSLTFVTIYCDILYVFSKYLPLLFVLLKHLREYSQRNVTFSAQRHFVSASAWVGHVRKGRGDAETGWQWYGESVRMLLLWIAGNWNGLKQFLFTTSAAADGRWLKTCPDLVPSYPLQAVFHSHYCCFNCRLH